MTEPELVEQFFRHEYGRLVAMLLRRVGVQHIEIVEYAVQSALMSALEAWPMTGRPDNPSAWLFRVAHNELVGELRQRTRQRRLAEANSKEDRVALEPGPEIFLAGELQEDLLRMLFVCCDEEIPVESQLVLALKTLCGFGGREIAHRLFTSEANVYKRLARARSRLQELPIRPEVLTDALGEGGRVLCTPRAARAFSPPPAESRGRDGRVARSRGWTRGARRLRTSNVARGFVLVGGRARRLASAGRRLGSGETLSRSGAQLGAHGRGEGAAVEALP